MKVLITGAAGFVGGHLITAFRSADTTTPVEIVTTSANGGDGHMALDVADRAQVEEVIAAVRPDCIVNLAGIAAPGKARSDPDAAWRIHLHGARHLGEAILAGAPDCLLIAAGTGLAYGDSARPGAPLDETALLAPNDDYGASKAAGDIALGAMAARGLRVVRMRPFNHLGPGQSADFVASAFASQIAEAEAGRRAPTVNVGNLDAERDFLDVRDVVDAYVRVALQGDGIQSGEVFNIASGKARPVADILSTLIGMAAVEIEVRQDPQRMRPAEIARVVGDAGKARHRLGWSPHIDLRTSLEDVLAEARNRGDA